MAPEIDPKSSRDFRETDPRPLVRSRVSATLWQWTKEGLFNKNIVVKHFLSTWKRDHKAKNTRPPYCCAMFLSSLQVSICNSSYFNPNLRLKQVKWLNGWNLKHLQLKRWRRRCSSNRLWWINGFPPSRFTAGQVEQRRDASIFPGFSPLIISSLINDQIRKSNDKNLKAAALNVKRKENTENWELDYGFAPF